MTSEALCLHLLPCLFDGRGFAPDGRVTFSLLVQRESNQRESTPRIRPRLRRGSLAPSPLQGHATKGHPWPIVALATSMSLNPLRGDSTRPPEGDLGVVCPIAVEEQRQKPDAANFNFAKITQACGPVPFRRPSGGVAQGDEPHGCGERLNGPGMAHVSRPRSSAGAREVSRSETRMSGCPSLAHLSWASKKGVAPVRGATQTFSGRGNG